MEKEVFIITVNEDMFVTEKKYKVFLDAAGIEIARSKPFTCTITPGDSTHHYGLVGDRTRAMVDALHTPEVVAAHKASIASVEV